MLDPHTTRRLRLARIQALARQAALVCLPVLLLVCDHVRPAPAASPTASTIVYLGRSDGWTVACGGNLHGGRLGREIVRQAVLIAARDELRLTTRDAWLDDPAPQEDVPIVDMAASPGMPSLLEITYGPAGQQAVLWHQELMLSEPTLNYDALVARMETLSRGKFVEVLRKAGFKARPQATKGGGKPPDVEPWLTSLSIPSQFEAVRMLHAQLATQGESSRRLAGLARGYAHLGVMTEYFWHPMHAVFKARALLYAERLVARDHFSASALVYRAYVHALVGLPSAALNDLAWAKTAGKQPAKLPAWVSLVEAFCRFDVPQLDSKDPAQAQLAALLRLVAAEQAGVPERISTEAEQSSRVAPECFRISDGFGLNSGSDVEQRARTPSMASGEVLATTLYQRLAELPDLPAELKALLAERAPKGRAAANEPLLRGEVITLLRGMADDSKVGGDEIPWALLGRLIEEVSFFQAWRHLRPEAEGHTGAGLDELLLGVPSHRYRGFLIMARRDPTVHRRGFRDLLAHRDWELIEPWHSPLMTHLTAFQMRDTEGIPATLGIRVNQTARELTLLGTDPRLTLQISPYSPWARAALIAGAWSDYAERAAEWEQSSAGSPHVLEALGNQWAAAGKYDDAERALKKALEQQPAPSTLRALADLAARRGRKDERIEYLKRVLKTPGAPQLDQTAADLAHLAMEAGDWEAAKKYAATAAEHRSAVGLLTAAEVSEVLQDWQKADATYQTIAQNFSDSQSHEWIEWLSYCKRTGQGDEAAAQEAAARQFIPLARIFAPAPAHTKPHLLLLTYYQLNSNLPEARKAAQEGFQVTSDPLFGLYAALASDSLKEPQVRDEQLAQIKNVQPAWTAAHADRPQEKLFALAALLAGDLAQQGDSHLTGAEIRKLASGASEAEKIDLYYLLGAYLVQHGKGKMAMSAWEECMVYLPLRSLSRTLAGKELWSRAVHPRQYAERLRNRAVASKPAAKPAPKQAAKP